MLRFLNVILLIIVGALLVFFKTDFSYSRTEKDLVIWVDLSSYRKIGHYKIHHKMADNIFKMLFFY